MIGHSLKSTVGSSVVDVATTNGMTKVSENSSFSNQIFVENSMSGFNSSFL
jgi:hypothetical protein